jgi:hypothetical protein
MADFNFEIPDDYLKDLLENDFDNYNNFITTFNNRLDEIKYVSANISLSYNIQEEGRRNDYYHQSISMWIYEERMETNEENNSTYYVFDWKSTTHSGVNKFDEVHSTNLVANCKVGEFEIDGQIINGISVGKKLKDIDNQAIAAKGYREHYEHKKDITYLAKLDYMPLGGERSGSKAGYKQGYYSDYEGAHRVSYTIPSEESLEYTFIGKQQNGKIMYDKDLGMQAAFDGLQNPTELAERVESGGMTGAIVAWALAAFFVLLAVLGMKKKKEN